MFAFDPFHALTFDCYGTLIDWEAGIETALRSHCRRHAVAKPDLEAFLAAFGRLETAIQQTNPTWPYPRVLAALFRRLALDFALPCDESDAERFGASIGDWPPFADTHDALVRLQRRFKLIVVSNVDRESFSRSESAMGVKFDGIVTAQDVGAYKPDVRMFEAAQKEAARLGIVPGALLHVAQSLFHDIAPANRLSIPSVWVDRRRRPGGATPDCDARPDLTVSSLAELAALVESSALRAN